MWELSVLEVRGSEASSTMSGELSWSGLFHFSVLKSH